MMLDDYYFILWRQCFQSIFPQSQCKLNIAVQHGSTQIMELVTHGDTIALSIPTGITRNETEKGKHILKNRCPSFLLWLFSKLKPSHDFSNESSAAWEGYCSWLMSWFFPTRKQHGYDRFWLIKEYINSL